MIKEATSQNDDWYDKAFYRTSAVALIRNDKGQVLMVNEHGRFTLPGGGWDYSESLHDALTRELYEEIELTSDFKEYVIAALPFYNPNRQVWHMWIACHIEYDKLNFGVGEHASEVKWFSEDEINEDELAGKLTKWVLNYAKERRQ